MGLLTKSTKPKKQWYGGSEEAYKAQQGVLSGGVTAADKAAASSVGRINLAADDASRQYGEFATGQQQQAAQAGSGFQSQMAGVDRNAGQIEDAAGRLEQDYKRTAELQFAANQNRAANQAAATASTGGAAGLRTALASQAQAGADAAAQAEITRAQEANQLADRKLGAYATAAGIRQEAGGLYSGRQQNAYANQASAIGGQYAAQQGAAELGAGTAVAQQGNYLNAQTAMETAQLNAAREREQQRQDQKRTQYNRWTDPFGTHTSR